MDIQLKEREITEAIKNYVALQGININGKTITVSYTAGRKESGISAEISIEDNLLTSAISAVKSQFPNKETKDDPRVISKKPEVAPEPVDYVNEVALPEEDETPFALQTGLAAGEIPVDPEPVKATSLFK